MQSHFHVQSIHNFEKNMDMVRKKTYSWNISQIKHMKSYCIQNINSEFNETFNR